MPVDLVVRGKRVFTPRGEGPAAVHIDRLRGTIAAVTPIEAAPPVETIDAGDLCVLPGLVDTHVHINDPGRTDWEGFETATRAAAAGGVTTLVDMPLNSIPPTTTLAGLEAKLAALESKARVDVALCGGLVPSNAQGQLVELFREGVLAYKCFLAESGVAEFAHVHEDELRAGMRELAKIDAPLFVHAELPGPLAEGEEAARGLDPRKYATYLASRPRRAEDAAIELVLRLAKETGARAHVVHLSSSDALPLFAKARAARAPITVETCPHYLTFTAEEIPDGDTAFKCAPPIRERNNREKLWDALREGIIDQVVTDHSPSTVELKCSGSGDFMKAWGGISSLQLGLAAIWTEARARGRSIRDVVEWMCAAPARLAGLSGRKGAIVAGADADLVLWDPDAAFEVDVATLEHRNKVSPYHGRKLTGATMRTLLRGRTIYRRGVALADTPQGRWVRRAG